ncbi:MAG: HAMP domain-containing protein [Roseiflexaceae bacterium]|nr:HAMP domain-containing protein [Roseiflexaceae bacterium]
MSIRRRLTISYISFFAFALIVLDIGLYLLVRQALISNIDAELGKAAYSIQKDFQQRNRDTTTMTSGEMRLQLLEPPSIDRLLFARTIVQVHLTPQTGIMSAPVTNMSHPISADPAMLYSAFAGKISHHTIVIDSHRLRETMLPLQLNGAIVGALQIARPLEETDEALRLLALALIGGGGFVILVAGSGGAWLTRAAFSPIVQIAATTQSIVKAEDLSRRVPVPAAQDELQHLTVTINDMLARLEQQFDTQRRFLADVSHELRTPLAAMRGNLEVLDRGAARDPQLLAESIGDMRSEVSRLIRMVNDLLLLAQSEGNMQLHREPVEVDSLLLEVYRELRTLTNGVQLRLGHEDALTVTGDRDRIKQALLNLAANAIQHTSPGGSVTLNVARQGEQAVLSVVDTGTGISPEDLPHIFERFYRADRARSRVRGGAGLGLPIVKWIVEAHGGQVLVESTPGQGSTFTLLLPLAVDPGQSSAAASELLGAT